MLPFLVKALGLTFERQYFRKQPTIESFTSQICDEHMKKIEEHSTSPALHTPCALVNAGPISFEQFEGSPTDQSFISQVSLLLNELSRQLCTNLNDDEDDWSVDDYVRTVDSTGWRTSRRYLFVSLASSWDSVGLLRQYKTL